MISDKIMLPDTIHYYPTHLRVMPEFKELAKCFDYMLRLVYDALDKQNADSFYLSLTADGCEIYEKLLGINSQPNEDLVTRRQRIIAAQFAQPPYTEKRLKEALDTALGADSYQLDIDRKNQRIYLHMGINLSELGEAARNVAEKMIPMNIEFFVDEAVQQDLYCNARMAIVHEVIKIEDIKRPPLFPEKGLFPNEGLLPRGPGI